MPTSEFCSFTSRCHRKHSPADTRFALAYGVWVVQTVSQHTRVCSAGCTFMVVGVLQLLSCAERGDGGGSMRHRLVSLRDRWLCNLQEVDPLRRVVWARQLQRGAGVGSRQQQQEKRVSAP